MRTSTLLVLTVLLTMNTFHVCISEKSVSFHPSPKNLSSVHPYTLDRATTDQLAIFRGACHEDLTTKCKEIFQSSFRDTRLPVIPASNGFVESAIEAYNRHHHLVIRPDDVWITILTQLNLYVNAHSEELRHLFIAHQGKKELQIKSFGNRYEVDFGMMAERMGSLIQQNIVDLDLREWIIPTFTTTTVNDRVVSSIVMMATLKAYFSYEFSLACGIPRVTLLGEKKDWEQLLTKLDKLLTFGNDTAQWQSLLKPVISHFVKAFDYPNSDENKNFWQKIAHERNDGSGPTWLSGWITAFTFFDKEGQSLYKNTRGVVLDGVQYHVVDSEDITPAYAEVPVRLDDNGEIFKTNMVAGVTGYSVSDSGVTSSETGHDGKQDSVQAVSGWWIFEEKRVKRMRNE